MTDATAASLTHLFEIVASRARRLQEASCALAREEASARKEAR